MSHRELAAQEMAEFEQSTANDRLDPDRLGHPGFLAALEEVRRTHIRKSADYGTDGDLFANVRASAGWGVEPWVGALVRANDKVVRLQAAAKGSTLVNEGVEDSLLDLASYALIALALYRETGSD